MLGQNRFLNPLNLMVAVSLAAGFALAQGWASALPERKVIMVCGA